VPPACSVSSESPTLHSRSLSSLDRVADNRLSVLSLLDSDELADPNFVLAELLAIKKLLVAT
jgi:hypothetical protein